MKKSYVKPTMEVVSYDAQTSLLAGSSDESNPYWEGPGEVPASLTGGVENNLTEKRHETLLYSTRTNYCK